MHQFLVTGPAGFLGFHVIKLLNSRGITPRVFLPPDADPNSPAQLSLKRLNIEPVNGRFSDLASLRTACQGIDIVLHLNFLIKLGGGWEVERGLHDVNVSGTRHLLIAAAEERVKRVVVSSSALTVGLNREPQPLDESASWQTHGFDLPYALSRRQAEQEALARTSEQPEVVAVNPSFTLGPDDYVGAPANKLVMKMSQPGFRMNAPIGFGALDVRDYADGVLRAAEQGRHGQRYLLSGENVMPRQLLAEVAAVVGIQPSRRLITIRRWMAGPLVTAVELWSRIRRQPPKVTREILALWGRYAWYDTSLARRELGWNARPLAVTLQDTIRWMRDNGQG